MSDIVVTGRLGSTSLSPFGFDMDFFSAGFGAYYIAYGSTTINAAAGAGSHNFTLPASANHPRVETVGLTGGQQARVMQALENAGRSDGFETALDQMRQNNGTFTVRVTEQHPSWFTGGPDQAAGIRITLANPGGPIRDVEIVVIGSRLGIGGESFANRLAHEIPHMFRNADGSFYTESQVQQIDGPTYQALFSRDPTSEIGDSLDVVAQYLGNGYWAHTGTAGNNYFNDELGNWDLIHTGAGNDIVHSGMGSDTITVNGGGVKVISDYGNGYDWLETPLIYNMSDVVLTQLNYDLVVTSAQSNYAPHEDPDAIFIVDWWFFFGNDSVELIRTGSGEVAGLLMLAGGYPGGGGYYYDPPRDPGSGAFFGLDEARLEARPLWSEQRDWELEPSATGRYAGITSYTSHRVSESVDLAATVRFSLAQKAMEYLPADTESVLYQPAQFEPAWTEYML